MYLRLSTVKHITAKLYDIFFPIIHSKHSRFDGTIVRFMELRSNTVLVRLQPRHMCKSFRFMKLIIQDKRFPGGYQNNYQQFLLQNILDWIISEELRTKKAKTKITKTKFIVQKALRFRTVHSIVENCCREIKVHASTS